MPDIRLHGPHQLLAPLAAVLDPTFEEDLQVVLTAVPRKGRQMLLFSATMTPSFEALRGIMSPNNTFTFHAYQGLKTVEQLRQTYCFVPAKVKEVYLQHVLLRMEELKVRSCIVFVGTTRTCQLVELLLLELGHQVRMGHDHRLRAPESQLCCRCLSCRETLGVSMRTQVAALHSNKSQRHRLSSLARFKARACPILVATDVASRGLDIPTGAAMNCTHVDTLSFAAPGRSSRASAGVTIALLPRARENEDRVLDVSSY